MKSRPRFLLFVVITSKMRRSAEAAFKIVREGRQKTLFFVLLCVHSPNASAAQVAAPRYDMDRFGIVFRASPVSCETCFMRIVVVVEDFFFCFSFCLLVFLFYFFCLPLFHFLSSSSSSSSSSFLPLKAPIGRDDCGGHADQQDGARPAQGLRPDARAALGHFHGQVRVVE